jgi:rare lipoprotein A
VGHDAVAWFLHDLIADDVTAESHRMRWIKFVPTVFRKQHLPSGKRDLPSALQFGCGVLASLLLATTAAAGERRGLTAKVQPAEAQGGNPPSYEVFGRRYRVRTSSDGYRERGVASWYGRPFHGRPTSSGEMYDMNEMTAAHTSLPLPTWVEVTNLANGKRIVVKVNDRGPFVDDRLIDLSYAAATALDLVNSGTGRVEIRALSEPPANVATVRRSDRGRPGVASGEPVKVAATVKSTPSPPQAQGPPRKPATAPSQPVTAPPTLAHDRLFAQAGKFTKRADAVALVDSLKAQGYVNAFVVTEDGRRKSTHRVRVGPLVDAQAVERMSDELRDLGARRSRSVVMP